MELQLSNTLSLECHFLGKVRMLADNHYDE